MHELPIICIWLCGRLSILEKGDEFDGGGKGNTYDVVFLTSGIGSVKRKSLVFEDF